MRRSTFPPRGLGSSAWSGSGDKDAGRGRELGQRSCYPEVRSEGNTLSHKTKQYDLSTDVFKKLKCLSTQN